MTQAAQSENPRRMVYRTECPDEEHRANALGLRIEHATKSRSWTECDVVGPAVLCEEFKRGYLKAWPPAAYTTQIWEVKDEKLPAGEKRLRLSRLNSCD